MMRDRRSSADSADDVDSAATTLLASAASSKGHSLDEPRRYADIELDRFETQRRRDGRLAMPRGAVVGGRIDDDDDDDSREDQHLLARDTVAAAALSDDRQAAGLGFGVPERVEMPGPGVSVDGDEVAEKQKVSWSSLPRKDQLAILTIARLSEPLAQTSLQSYMFYQLKSFRQADGSVPLDSTVAKQAGMLQAAFTGAQLVTALMWGRLADWEGMGRKRVLLIGLLGTALGVVGFGFSTSFAAAAFWRAVAGMLNGNVGVMRTMISEIVKEKKYQSRAFLLLPMTFNIGVIIGPLLGGLLADPAGSYPGVFGPGGTLGGDDGVWLFMRWPYALPNLVNASFLLLSSAGVLLGLEETLEGLREKPDYGLRVARWISRNFLRHRARMENDVAVSAYAGADDVELRGMVTRKIKDMPAVRRKLPFRKIWTRNVLCVLVSQAVLAMHVGTFANLWFIFLSTPRYSPGEGRTDVDSNTTTLLRLPEGYVPHAPFTFTGGLGLPPRAIGTALAIFGVMGITLQLVLYPRWSSRLGTIGSFRGSIALFPLTYCAAPFLAIVPSTVPPPAEVSGALIWIAIAVVLLVQTLARTFALPAAGILVNNSSPHPSVLGTIHGIAQMVSAGAKTASPMFISWIYGVGLNNGVVGTAWWTMAGIAVVGAAVGRLVREGDGHEIWLDGERDDEVGGGG